jgi:hypothetical protein
MEHNKPIEILSSEESKAIIRREGGYLAPRAMGDIGVFNPEGFKKPPKGKKIVQQRQGRGGIVKYVGWTNTADAFDDGFGVGNWGFKQLQVVEFEKPDPKNKTSTITEVNVMIEFDARGLYMPMQAWGHGDYFSKDASGSKSDAIETAISRALSKVGARLFPYLRAVWGKDDKALAEIMPPSDTAVTAVKILVDQLSKGGKKDLVEGLITKSGIVRNGDGPDYRSVSANELDEFRKAAANLL